MFELRQILTFSFPLICWILVLSNSFTFSHGASRISNNYGYGYNYQRKPLSSSSSVLKEEQPAQRCSKGSHKRIPDQHNSNKFYMCTYNNAHHIWMVYSFNCPTDTVFDKSTQKCITKQKQEANLLKQNSFALPSANKIKLVPNSHTIISDKNSNQSTNPSRKTNNNSKVTPTGQKTQNQNKNKNQNQYQNQVNINYPIRIITPTSSSSNNINIQRVASTTPYNLRVTNRPTIPSRTSTKNRFPQIHNKNQNQNQPTTVRIPSRFPTQTQTQAQNQNQVPVPYTRRTTAATSTTTTTTESPSTTITTTTEEATTNFPVKSSSSEIFESSTDAQSQSQSQSSNGNEHLGVIKMITGKIAYLAQAIDALLHEVESTMKSNAEACNDEQDAFKIRPNVESQTPNQKQDKDENPQLSTISPVKNNNFNIFDFFKYTPLNLSYHTLNETINRISSTTETTTINNNNNKDKGTTEKIQIVHPTSSSVDFMDTNEENVSEEQEQEQEEEASEEEQSAEVDTNKTNDNAITQATSFSSSSSAATTDSSTEWNVFLNENNKQKEPQSQTQTQAEKASVASQTTTSASTSTSTDININANANDSAVLESSTRENVRIPEEKRVESPAPSSHYNIHIPTNSMFPSSSSSSLVASSPTKSSQDIINSLESISKVKVSHRRPRRSVHA